MKPSRVFEMFTGSERDRDHGPAVAGRCLFCKRSTDRVVNVGTMMNPRDARACERCLPDSKVPR